MFRQNAVASTCITLHMFREIELDIILLKLAVDRRVYICLLINAYPLTEFSFPPEDFLLQARRYLAPLLHLPDPPHHLRPRGRRRQAALREAQSQRETARPRGKDAGREFWFPRPADGLQEQGRSAAARPVPLSGRGQASPPGVGGGGAGDASSADEVVLVVLEGRMVPQVLVLQRGSKDDGEKCGVVGSISCCRFVHCV